MVQEHLMHAIRANRYGAVADLLHSLEDNSTVSLKLIMYRHKDYLLLPTVSLLMFLFVLHSIW